MAVSPVLAVDIGNSRTVLGLVDGRPGGGALDGTPGVPAHWLVRTGERTADEWLALLHGLVGEQHRGLAGIAVCATVPGALSAWREMLSRRLGSIASVVVEPGVRTGIPLRVDNPREVGADRIANAVAAVTWYGGPAVVVDFGGTATTFDVVSAAGEYLGGAIAPGIEAALAALGQRGAQLCEVELVRPRTAIARKRFRG